MTQRHGASTSDCGRMSAALRLARWIHVQTDDRAIDDEARLWNVLLKSPEGVILFACVPTGAWAVAKSVGRGGFATSAFHWTRWISQSGL